MDKNDDNDIPISDASSCSSNSDPDSPRSSVEPVLKHEARSCTPLSSPDSDPSQILEPKSLLSMYTNVEVGVVASLDKRDEFLLKQAQIKRSIAKAEKKLAHCRAKETLLAHRLQCIKEELAERRILQANINIERAKFLHKRRCETPRQVDTPDILTLLARPSVTMADNLVGVCG